MGAEERLSKKEVKGLDKLLKSKAKFERMVDRAVRGIRKIEPRVSLKYNISA